MRDFIYLVITIAVTIINLISYMPQIIKLIKTKSADDLSLGSYILFDSGYILYTVLMIMDHVGIGLFILQLTETTLCIITTICIAVFKKKKQKEILEKVGCMKVP